MTVTQLKITETRFRLEVYEGTLRFKKTNTEISKHNWSSNLNGNESQSFQLINKRILLHLGHFCKVFLRIRVNGKIKMRLRSNKPFRPKL